MKIAINITPLKTQHKDRGIGYYTSHLVESLKKDESLDIMEFTDLNQIKDVDLIHYPWFDFYFHTLQISRSAKTIITIHDVIPLIFPEHYPPGIKGKINFYLQKLALRSVKAIITDSYTSKKDICKYLKINEDLIYPIHLASDKGFRVLPESKLLKVKRKFNLSHQFLLFVGDANWVKNLPFLIESFSRLLKREKFKDLSLVMVGDVFLKKVDNIDHPELESLKKVNQLIKELDLENKVIRLGKLGGEDLVAFYNLATLYIQPSFYEGFGLPVLEALSCGTPVVCSDRGSLKEVGGAAAVYFDPEDTSQFLNLTSEILINKSLRYKLSNLAIKQAAKFSWEKVLEETKDVYLKVLNG